MWVNHNTGEVSDECPWIDTSTASMRDDHVLSESEGGGSLVYDRKELDDMFSYLDSASAEK